AAPVALQGGQVVGRVHVGRLGLVVTHGTTLAARGHGWERDACQRPGTREPALPQPSGSPSCSTACTSTSILTLLATSTPPVSSAWFHFRPHSRRSIS